MSARACKDCRHSDDGAHSQKICRRYPPRLVPLTRSSRDGVIDTTIRWTWPEVHPDAWCGEFQPADGKGEA